MGTFNTRQGSVSTSLGRLHWYANLTLPSPLPMFPVPFNNPNILNQSSLLHIRLWDESDDVEPSPIVDWSLTLVIEDEPED
jgi:hypothetical protein